MRFSYELLVSLATVVGLTGLYFVTKYFYQRLFLAKRLFFEPWTNLSNDDEYDFGASLSDLLFFELERLRELLQKAESDDGLWHEPTTLPMLERAFDGYPIFVRHVEQLGLRGKLGQLIRLVLMTRPPALRGTIHRFGEDLRLQVALEGTRTTSDRAATHVWSVNAPATAREKIPDGVEELAHLILLDFMPTRGFRQAQGYKLYTRGLREHLAFNETQLDTYAKAARVAYEEAIEVEGHNAIASYHLAELLYAQYSKPDNERAIEEYYNALRSESPPLRARAFRGLANAYCQQVQRHQEGERLGLATASLYASFAGEECSEADIATIRKAQAYAAQVQAELVPRGDDRAEQQRRQFFDNAVRHYKEAIEARPQFTVAHNNLGHLYLKEAEREAGSLPVGSPNMDSSTLAKRDSVLNYLELAESCCREAINSDNRYPHSWDNLGNVLLMQASLMDGDWARREELMREAEKAYFKALSYSPRYGAAASDLARLYLHRAQAAPVGRRRQDLGGAWHFHMQALNFFNSAADAQDRECQSFSALVDDLARGASGGFDIERHAVCTCGDGVEPSASSDKFATSG